jgi:hypothetical protein
LVCPADNACDDSYITLEDKDYQTFSLSANPVFSFCKHEIRNLLENERFSLSIKAAGHHVEVDIFYLDRYGKINHISSFTDVTLKYGESIIGVAVRREGFLPREIGYSVNAEVTRLRPMDSSDDQTIGSMEQEKHIESI